MSWVIVYRNNGDSWARSSARDGLAEALGTERWLADRGAGDPGGPGVPVFIVPEEDADAVVWMLRDAVPR